MFLYAFPGNIALPACSLSCDAAAPKRWHKKKTMKLDNCSPLPNKLKTAMLLAILMK